MAKIITLVVVLIVIQCSLQAPEEKPEVHGKPHEHGRFKECHALLDEKIRKALREHKTLDDEKFKKYVFCYFEKAGFMSKEGELNEDVLKAATMCGLRSAKKGEEVFKKCIKKEDTPENTAVTIRKCYIESWKVHREAMEKKGDN